LRNLVISNVTEFNQNNVRGLYVPSEWEMWRRAGDDLSDMAAFWAGPDKVLLAPPGTDRPWLEDVQDALGWTIDLVEPPALTGRLLDDTLLSPPTLGRLVDLVDGGAVIEPWGATIGVLRLDAALYAAGVRTSLPAPAPESLWTVNYLDSKLALQDLGQRIADLNVPAALTATSFDHLLGMVRLRVADRRPFAVKGNVGVGGFGMFAAVEPDWNLVIAELVEAIGDEPIFREGPFLIQDWVASPPDELRPTYDGIVDRHGHVVDVGVGGMLIDGCTYRGVTVGDTPLADSVVQQARQAGRAVGECASALGYRGWYDVDFVTNKAGKVFATEINARRTSPAHAFDLLTHWNEQDPSIRCVYADDHVAVGRGRPQCWEGIRDAIVGTRSSRVRCVATIVRTLSAADPTLGVAIGAGDYEGARSACHELGARLARPQRAGRAAPSL
jgi:hypothetical protein